MVRVIKPIPANPQGTSNPNNPARPAQSPQPASSPYGQPTPSRPFGRTAEPAPAPKTQRTAPAPQKKKRRLGLILATLGVGAAGVLGYNALSNNDKTDEPVNKTPAMTKTAEPINFMPQFNPAPMKVLQQETVADAALINFNQNPQINKEVNNAIMRHLGGFLDQGDMSTVDCIRATHAQLETLIRKDFKNPPERSVQRYTMLTFTDHQPSIQCNEQNRNMLIYALSRRIKTLYSNLNGYDAHDAGVMVKTFNTLLLNNDLARAANAYAGKNTRESQLTQTAVLEGTRDQMAQGIAPNDAVCSTIQNLCQMGPDSNVETPPAGTFRAYLVTNKLLAGKTSDQQMQALDQAIATTRSQEPTPWYKSTTAMLIAGGITAAWIFGRARKGK